MTTPQDAILARRRLTNKLIAGHQADRLRPFFAPDATVMVGNGGLLAGADAVIQAFAQQFRDPDFVTYERTPQTVELDAAGDHAAETGRWVGRWKTGGMAGTYLAGWRKVMGQWVIESELYLTLGDG